MADPVSWKVVEPGWAVVSSDGEEVGTVHEVLGDPEADIFSGIRVNEGLLLKRRDVDADSVGEIDVGSVHLTIDAAAFSALAET
jgi:uncharacterized protein YrrD